MVVRGVATVAKSRDGQAGEGTLPMKGMTQQKLGGKLESDPSDVDQEEKS